MLWWDGQFLARCEDVEISMELYKRYVDDVNSATWALPAGTVYTSHGLQVDAGLAEQEREEEPDKVTARVLRELANSITPMIRMVEDFPSNHLSGKLPILDLEVWLEGGLMLHQFYKKQVASKFVVSAQSAFPASKKRAVLVEEGVRRLRNNSPELPPAFKARFLTELALEMQNSGHRQSFRAMVLDTALKKYQIILGKHQRGEEDMYRTRADITAHKEAKGGIAARERYFRRPAGQGGQRFTGTLKVPPSPGSELRTALQRALTSHQGPRGTMGRVEEVGGAALKTLLVRSDPFRRARCGRPACPLGGAPAAPAPSRQGRPSRASAQGAAGTRASSRIRDQRSSQPAGGTSAPSQQPRAASQPTGTSASSSSQPVQQPQPEQQIHPALCEQATRGCSCSCYATHHNYEWSCTRCDLAILQHQRDHGGDRPAPRPKYKGESSRTPLTRAEQHLAAYRRKEENSFMWEHTAKEHGGEVQGKDYVLTVTATDRDPVRRVLREAVRIRSAAEGREESMMALDGGELRLRTQLMNDKVNEWFGTWLLTPTMTEL
jgi:hypothetical protein